MSNKYKRPPVLDWREVDSLIALLEDIEGGLSDIEDAAFTKLRAIRAFQQQRNGFKKKAAEKQKRNKEKQG